MPKPTRPELLKFAAAGVAYILIANVLVLFLFSSSLRMMDVPAFQTIGGIAITCGGMQDNHWDTHPLWQMHWLSYGHEVILLTFAFIGFVWYRAIRKNNRNHKSVGLWLSILLMACELYYGAMIITIAIMSIIRGKPLNDLLGASTANMLIAICTILYSVIVGLWLYLKVFRKEERKYLWLLSLPAIVITFFAWCFVIGPMVVLSLR